MNSGGGSSAVTSTSLLPPWAYTLDPSNVKPVDKYIELVNLEFQAAYSAYAEKTFALQGEGFLWEDELYPGQGVQTVSSHTYEVDGIKALAARGRDGHTLLTKGETLLRDVIDGLRLNANTKIDDAYLRRAEIIVKNFEENTLPRLAQQMNLSNNFGSYGHHYLMAKAAEDVMAKLAEIGMDLYFKDYVLEKTFQQDAISVAPLYSEQELANAELQIKAGELQREYDQGRRIDDYNKWKEAKVGALKKLDMAGNALAKLMGMGSKEIIPYYRPSDISQIAGLALAGMGIYGAMKSSGMKTVGPAAAESGTGGIP